ncbi:MAG: sensor histidine kinase [Azospirillaceae bacterium]|nr:sensor histidine kinase [Azospirillaceae bacterium]
MARVLIILTIVTAACLGLRPQPVIAGVASSTPVELTDGAPPASLLGHMDLVRDPGDRLTLADVAFGGVAFAPVAGPVGLGFTKDAIWMRVRLHRPPDDTGRWTLELEPPYIDQIDVYIASVDRPAGPGDFKRLALGAQRPFASRPVAAPTFLIPLDLPPGTVRDVYVHARSATAMILKGSVYNDASLAAMVARSMLGFGLLIGVYTFGAIFNLICFLWLRDWAYLLYAGYITALIVDAICASGIGAMALPGVGHIILQPILGMQILLAGALWIGFTVRVLDLRRKMPWVGNGMMVLSAIFIGGAIMVLFGDYRTPVRLAQTVAPVLCLIVTAAIARLVIQGDRKARQFAFAFAPALVGVVVITLRAVGVLPSTGFTDYGYAVATLFHVVLINITMMTRIRDAEHAKAIAQAAALSAAHEAESRALCIVDEQTRELRAAKTVVEDALDTERQAIRDQLQFIDMIAHEYRTPVAVIRTGLDVLDLMPAAAGHRPAEVVTRMRRAINRLVELIEVGLRRDLINQPGLSLSLVDLDLAAFAADTVQERSSAGPITLDRPAAAIPVHADATLLRTAILNLLDNARKYGPAHGLIRVEAGVVAGRAFVRVTDQGPGIPLAARDRVFEKFYRGPGARTVPGVGLGLYLVRKIMMLHQGGLELESAAPGDCTFRLWLPTRGGGGAAADRRTLPG